MRAIRDMSILEIDITNACNHACSNCTRFCGHHKKPYFMDFDTFRRAIDSLDGFRGLISIMGGEPLLHPEFERFAAYLEEKRKTKALFDKKSKAIVKDYLAYAQAQRWFNNSYNRGAGYNVFTSIPPQFYDHYERIQDTFTHMFLNDHTSPSFHQPILISRKDLGISDEDFAVMREKCWLQNFWSASITPKGAFFCEVAGTLDMLLNGSGGWKIEPGWWKRDISAYKEQFHYCDLCGMALKTFSRNANDEVDDASKTLYEKLKDMETPRFGQGKVQLYQPGEVKKDGERFGEDMNSVTANYEPDYEKRVSTAAENLRPRHVLGVYIVENQQQADAIPKMLNNVQERLDGIFLVSASVMKDAVQQYSNQSGCQVLYGNSHKETYGALLNCALGKARDHDWLLLLSDTTQIAADFTENIRMRYLNPGYLFEYQYFDTRVVMFNKTASSIRQAGFDAISWCRNERGFLRLWQLDKKCILSADFAEQDDMDLEYFRNIIYENYAADEIFKAKLYQRIENSVAKGDKILVMHSAFVYHTLSIVRLLQEKDYDVYVISSEKFRPYFKDWLSEDKMSYFAGGLMRFSELKPMLDKLRQIHHFKGAVIPFFPGASMIKEIDAYTDVLQSAEYMAEKILGIINIRREFVEVEYDYQKK